MSNATAVEASGGVQSVDRALSILEILARSGECGVTEIAAALAVHKSTAFRLVTTLEQHGLVEQVEGRGKYRLGVGLLRLAGATSARLDVVQEARPLCKQLAASTGETVNLATLSGNSALYLDQVAGLLGAAVAQLGRPAHPAARDQQRQGADGLARPTPSSVTCSAGCRRTPARRSPARPRLRKQLAQVREDGYAVAVDELEIGLTAIAAPVHNAHGDVVCSISVSGPSFRLNADRIPDGGAAGRRCGRRAVAPAGVGAPMRVPRRYRRVGCDRVASLDATRRSDHCVSHHARALRIAQRRGEESGAYAGELHRRDLGGGGDGGRREIRCPADGSLVAEVDESTRADTEAAIAAAREAFDDGPWPRTSARERGDLLLRVADLLQRDRAELARTESLDTGKRLVESEIDIDDVTSVFRHFGRVADTDAGRVVDTGNDDVVSRVVHEPVGVCGLITPWNYPLLQVSWKVAPALAAGCTFVLKPSELSPSHVDPPDAPARRGRPARRRRQPGPRRRAPRRRRPERGRPGRPRLLHRRPRHRQADHGRRRRRR